MGPCLRSGHPGRSEVGRATSAQRADSRSQVGAGAADAKGCSTHDRAQRETIGDLRAWRRKWDLRSGTGRVTVQNRRHLDKATHLSYACIAVWRAQSRQSSLCRRHYRRQEGDSQAASDAGRSGGGSRRRERLEGHHVMCFTAGREATERQTRNEATPPRQTE